MTVLELRKQNLMVLVLYFCWVAGVGRLAREVQKPSQRVEGDTQQTESDDWDVQRSQWWVSTERVSPWISVSHQPHGHLGQTSIISKHMLLEPHQENKGHQITDRQLAQSQRRHGLNIFRVTSYNWWKTFLCLRNAKTSFTSVFLNMPSLISARSTQCVSRNLSHRSMSRSGVTNMHSQKGLMQNKPLLHNCLNPLCFLFAKEIQICMTFFFKLKALNSLSLTQSLSLCCLAVKWVLRTCLWQLQGQGGWHQMRSVGA